MDNATETAKCECVVDIEGYHQCASCANGTTDALDFFRKHDTTEDFNEEEDY